MHQSTSTSSTVSVTVYSTGKDHFVQSITADAQHTD